ncbi:hypothetical protein FACS189475_04940 [Betaproteobacteria bacterium]|nr:hypothetical protein FACS189475_04940 [Betaproteobacteria bacterium]
MPLDCLTLLVPELLWPEPEDHEALDRLECPGLTRLLARGRFSRAERQSVEAALMGLFGYVAAGVTHTAHTACGAFRLRGEPVSEVPAEAATARWIIADPVHLRFNRDRLLLAGGAALNIAPEEAAALVDGLNHYFADLGVFHTACAERWYLRLADGVDEYARHALERLDAPPLSAVAGRSVEHVLEEIIEEREIRKLLNEIQTFLHAHPVNRRREESNLATINSLWLWGGGTPPPTSPSTDFDSAWSNDPLTRGLALAANLPARALPESADALFANPPPGTRPLVVLGDLAEPVCYENSADYRQSLAALETRWFAPVWRALATGAIGRLRLVAPTTYGTLSWEASRSAPWCFWRRPQTLAETVAALIRHKERYQNEI